MDDWHFWVQKFTTADSSHPVQINPRENWWPLPAMRPSENPDRTWLGTRPYHSWWLNKPRPTVLNHRAFWLFPSKPHEGYREAYFDGTSMEPSVVEPRVWSFPASEYYDGKAMKPTTREHSVWVGPPNGPPLRNEGYPAWGPDPRS
jgi:hypothetical protein